MKLKQFITLITLFIGFYLFSQQSTYVDKKGVFRWSNTDKEIRLFGVNYTLPFAHGFRAINYIDKNHKQAIDKDIYHITRLGLDAYRIHIWDMEITDSLGNVIKTPQLDLLDYTLAKLKERGIKTIVTPFKVGGNGYPEKDFEVEGFSSKLGKWQTYAGDKVIEKQERYFTQLLNHVNPYTGIAYKNDPDIIALEINNEPRHDNAKTATDYINRMVKVIRNTGYKNPVFYNVSERSEFINAYCEANIQGCTFQWYPTGLVHNKTLKGNFLPNVNNYNIPFNDNQGFKNKARIIYEFDAGDTYQSYLYPAMARSFREAKFQFAAQFAYDPLDLAYANTEYQTHYLNLAYTPSKALSMLIASEVFHEMSSGQSHGRYPSNTTFGNTSLNTDKDLALYNSKTKYFYTNSTIRIPNNPENLDHIAGVGNSPIISYSGTGAYFLDKIYDGIWRLEIMPDVLWVNDPFAKASLKKSVAVIKWNEQKIKIDLDNLGDDFSIKAINTNNAYQTSVELNEFSVLPGTYILRKKGVDKIVNPNQLLGNIRLDEFVAPAENIDKIYLAHEPHNLLEENQDLLIEAKVATPNEILNVSVVVPAGYHKTENFEMVKQDVFNYKVEIPYSKIFKRDFSYYIVVNTIDGKKTFPNEIEGSPEDWDFISTKSYTAEVINNKDPFVVLFDSTEGFENTIWPYQFNSVKYNTQFIKDEFLSNPKMHLVINDLVANTPDMTFKVNVIDKVKERDSVVNKTTEIVVKATSGTKSTQKVQIALQLNNGAVFGKLLELNNDTDSYIIDYKELKRVNQVLLPRPYPVFQHYYFESNDTEDFDIAKIEFIQISIGPEIDKKEQLNQQEIVIDKIFLR